MTQLGRAATSRLIIMFVLFHILLFHFQLMQVGTAQFGQADLSKTEAHAEAPMTQLGRAAASNLIIAHVWLVSFFHFCFN